MCRTVSKKAMALMSRAESAEERGVDLLVTIDCGIANAREVAAARHSISTDHR